MKDYCRKCGWNDPDYGCTSPQGEEVWQCPLYRATHPEEVKQFEIDMKQWCAQDGVVKN
jgi:hypothetical protein